MDLVRVPVTVRDAAGRIMLTLSREDFVVREDGRTIPLSAFDPPSAITPTTSSARQGQQHGSFVVLLLDDLVSHPMSTTNIKRIANDFVAHMTDADVMAVTLLNGGQGTTSRRRADLLASIQAFRAASKRSSSPDDGAAVHAADAKHALDVISDLSAQLVHVSHPRKVLVFVGSPSLFYPTDIIGKNGERTFSSNWFDAVQSALKASISVYIVSPTGLTGAVDDGAIDFAVETGGQAFVNTNEFEHVADEIWDDASMYYVLGYEAPKGGKRKSHSIDVSVNWPDAYVRARHKRW